MYQYLIVIMASVTIVGFMASEIYSKSIYGKYIYGKYIYGKYIYVKCIYGNCTDAIVTEPRWQNHEAFNDEVNQM